MTKTVTTRGVIFIHSAPKALCPHVEWAISHVLKTDIKLQWQKQPIDEKVYRSEISWVGQVGSGAEIASALHGWEHLRYEITEEATNISEGSRWSHTPDLGIFYSQMDRNGNMVIAEDRIRKSMEYQDRESLINDLNLALGTAWDKELEPFRYSSDSANLRWLHHFE